MSTRAPGEVVTYSITYTMETGTVVHRASSASDASDTIRLMTRTGATVLGIVDHHGVEIDANELSRLEAACEAAKGISDDTMTVWGSGRVEAPIPRSPLPIIVACAGLAAVAVIGLGLSATFSMGP